MIKEDLIDMIMEQFDAMGGLGYFSRIKERTKLECDTRYLVHWANELFGKGSLCDTSYTG